MRYFISIFVLIAFAFDCAIAQTSVNPTAGKHNTTTVTYSITREDSLEIFAVLDSFIANFRRPLNMYLPRHLDTYHFPHVRIASGLVSVIPVRDSVPLNYWEARMPADWEYSKWVSRQIVQASASKVHLVTVFRRFRKDNSVIADENSLYIMDKVNGKWGVRARSSYAR